MPLLREGILQADALRDYLYREMRGAKGEELEPISRTSETGSTDDEALMLLREIRDALNAVSVKRERIS